MPDPWQMSTAGSEERFKGAVHLAILALATSAGLYNIGSWRVRPCRRLAWNVLAYAAIVALETRQVLSHLRRP